MDPRNQFSLRSSIDLPHDVEFDVWLRYVDRLEDFAKVDAYVDLDVRLAWRPKPNLELSIVGQNLLDDRHPEFTPTIIPTQKTETQRSVYGKIMFEF